MSVSSEARAAWIKNWCEILRSDVSAQEKAESAEALLGLCPVGNNSVAVIGGLNVLADHAPEPWRSEASRRLSVASIHPDDFGGSDS